MTKQELLSLLTETPCKDGLDVFMAFNGSAEEYFMHHKRGKKTLSWCISHLCKGAHLNLPNVQKVGSIILYEGVTLDLPNVQEVGYIRLFEGATLTLPNVQEVVYIRLFEGATLNMPKEAVIKNKSLAEGAKIVRL